MNRVGLVTRDWSHRSFSWALARAPLVAWLLVAGVTLAATPVLHAQIPDSFENLKVLPKEIGKGELVGVMRSFAGGLGVRCNHCHVGPDNLQGMDFATDEKETKRTARAMILMVKAINEQYLGKLDRGKPVELEVKCATCHRRQEMPRFIEDVVEKSIQTDGVDAAVARYGELREEYYGGYAYDFTAGPMSSLGEQLAKAGKMEEALAILTMNSDYNPESAWNRVLMAQVLFQSGDQQGAIAALEKALEYEPDNQFVKGQLEKMKTAMAEPDEAP